MNNPLNTPIKFSLAVAGAALLLCLAFAGFMTWRDHERAKTIVDLQNQIALRDKTIEVGNGEYQKLALQTGDLKAEIGTKDKQLQDLQGELKKLGDQLLSANTLVFQLKDQIAKAKPTVVVTTDPTTHVGKFTLSRTEEFGPFEVACSMSGSEPVNADSAASQISLTQPRPFKISLLVSQTKDGAWRSSATTSDPNFKVDIDLAAVNPNVLEEKWYEKLAIQGEAGISTSPGLLFGGGIDIEIGKFDVGPRIWAVLDHGATAYYGASLAWHPFKKVR